MFPALDPLDPLETGGKRRLFNGRSPCGDGSGPPRDECRARVTRLGR